MLFACLGTASGFSATSSLGHRNLARTGRGAAALCANDGRGESHDGDEPATRHHLHAHARAHVMHAMRVSTLARLRDAGSRARPTQAHARTRKRAHARTQNHTHTHTHTARILTGENSIKVAGEDGTVLRRRLAVGLLPAVASAAFPLTAHALEAVRVRARA